MNPELLSLLAFLGLLLLLIVITELLHRFFKLPVEQSRKFLHVSGGLMCLFLPHFFSSHWWVMALAGISFLLLLITYRNNMLDSIHKTKRRSIGSVIFPISVYGCFLSATLLHNSIFFYLPVSLLTTADTAAEIAGNRWGHNSKQFFGGQKTLAGTIGFLITAIPVCWGWSWYCDLSTSDTILLILLVSTLGAVTELITLHGWDNLSIPLVTITTLWLLLSVKS